MGHRCLTKRKNVTLFFALVGISNKTSRCVVDPNTRLRPVTSFLPPRALQPKAQSLKPRHLSMDSISFLPPQSKASLQKPAASHLLHFVSSPSVQGILQESYLLHFHLPISLHLHAPFVHPKPLRWLGCANGSRWNAASIQPEAKATTRRLLF